MKKYIHITSGVLTLTPDVVYNVSNTSKQGGIFVKRWLCLCLVVCMMISLPAAAMMEDIYADVKDETVIVDVASDDSDDLSSEPLEEKVEEIDGELGENGFVNLETASDDLGASDASTETEEIPVPVEEEQELGIEYFYARVNHDSLPVYIDDSGQSVMGYTDSENIFLVVDYINEYAKVLFSNEGNVISGYVTSFNIEEISINDSSIELFDTAEYIYYEGWKLFPAHILTEDNSAALESMYANIATEGLLASSRITIYNQGDDTYKYGRTTGTLKASACGLFTINHALQWVGINSIPSPRTMADTDKQRKYTYWDSDAKQYVTLDGYYSFDTGYFENSAAIYGYKAESIYSSCQDLNTFQAKLTEVFHSGGAVTFHVKGSNGFWGNTEGHYCLGIGISNDGSKIHIVDSSALSTLGVLKNTVYNGYYYQNGSLNLINKSWDKYTLRRTMNLKDDDIIGGEYWVDTEFILKMQYNPGWTIVISNPNGNNYPSESGSSSGGSSASNYNYPVSSYERCTYRIVQDFTWRKAASSSAEPNGKAKAGETFESEAIILNTDSNNMWLKKRGEDKYVFAGYKWDGSNWFLDNSQTQYLQFVSDNRNINWDSCNIPTTHQKGSSLALRGSLNADTRMISVTGEFYNGKSCWGNPTAAYPINGTNYPMYNSSLDNALKFGSLPESSNIVLVLTVKYRFNREQGTGTYTIEKPFAVIGSGSSGGNGSGGTSGGSTTGNTTTYEVITSQGLNVRSGAGTGYGVITTIWPGTTIAVTETATVGGVTWGHGTTSTGVNGWISLSGSLVRQVSVEPAKVALDVNGWLDGAVHGGLQSYGTVDVYINGQCVANDVDDYCSQWPVGSVYEIRDIKAKPGYIYKGVYDGVLFGTLGNQQVNVVLSFDRDSANPVISNVRVSNVTSEGYTVTCNVSDNLGVTQVKFPTWTEQNGQDDLIWHVGTLSGNTASFNVKVSDHKNERSCTYVTHIYAYDAAGNSTCTGVTVQVPAKAVEPDSVRINEGSDIYLDIGETKQLTVTVSPSNAANKAVTWKSEHPAIASVDANGRVTLLANGSAFIVATTWNGKSVRCTIKKSDKPKTVAPTGITLTPTAITIREGEVANVTATMTPANAVAARIWYSSDDSVAELEAAGRIRGVKAGTATITVKTDNEKTASCKVTVVANNVAVTGISLNKTSTTIYVGETEKLNATVQPGNATNKAVTWNSSAVSVATVDANGRITAIKKGTAKITATTVNGQTETCTVKVTEAPKAKSVKLDRKGTVELAAGSTLSLTATVSPGDARTGLTWSSSNVKAATVNANGTVNGVKEGTATITVKTDNGKKATVKVKVIDPYAPKSIAFAEKSVTAKVGEGYALRWTLTPSTARTSVNYKSSNTKTAIVSESGVVTGLKEGTVTITATTGNGKKATVKVKLVDPYKPSGIAFKDKNTTVNVGETLTLGWALTPSTARTTVTFKSSSTNTATVNANGVVLGIKEGTATITAATANGKKAKIKIKVSDPYKATGIALGSKTATIGVGETLALNWTLTPSTARTTVKFKSSNTKVATVDANGLVKGLKKGSATITATTANGKKATIKVKVG